MTHKNKIYISHRLQWIGLIAILLFGACEHENLTIPKPNENIRPMGDFIRNNYDFQLFHAALEYTELSSELNSIGPFTVLAITDKAFNAMGILNVQSISRLNKDSLRRVLQYHILPKRRLVTSDMPTNAFGTTYETLTGEDVSLSTINTASSMTAYVNGALIVRPNVETANGVLHVLDKMMQYTTDKTVQDFLAARAEYSFFVAGLKRFGLWDRLAEPGVLTVFPPRNQAFLDKNITLEQINELNTTVYNGKRLFGCYIMYDQSFFISDQHVFKNVGGEQAYRYNLPNDSWYVTFGTAGGRRPGETHWTYWPSLALMRPNPSANNPDLVAVVGRLDHRAQDVAIKPISNYDRVFTNGVVHDTHVLLAVPNDVLN